MKQFIKYLGVGTINTLITSLVIFIFMKFTNSGLYLSNVLGYIFGLLSSYILNSLFVFKSNNILKKKEFIKFIIVFLSAYTLNIISLYILSKIIYIGEYLSQYISMMIYSLSFFYLCKFYTFKKQI